MDYSDLYSIMTLYVTSHSEATELIDSFRGTPSGKGSHDEVARRIALNGQCWVEKSRSPPTVSKKELISSMAKR